MTSIYLDCNATTPIEPEVAEFVRYFLEMEFGNSGSRSHEYGAKANRAVGVAREQVANVVGAAKDEVIFTSGATESDNLAILGLAEAGLKLGKRHIITTAIEHKAVLEPVEALGERGFDVTLLQPDTLGLVRPEAIRDALRDDTLLVSIMHVNNETGVIQPLAEIAETIGDHPAFFHTDAAQGFGKELEGLRHPRIDMISISGHKIFAPKGVGALVMRRRAGELPPLSPLMFGGGQERGLRPGTIPVHLVAGLGLAAEIALRDHDVRMASCAKFKARLMQVMTDLGAKQVGDSERVIASSVSLSLDGVDSEAMMLVLKQLVAISNGSACTSDSYEPSHVLTAMGMTAEQAECVTRWSWCHMTEEPDWDQLISAIGMLM